MFKRFSLLALTCTVANVAAQAPVPPPPAVAPAGVQPTHHCVKPAQPGRLGTKNQFKVFDGESKKYRDCLQDYVKAQSDMVKVHADLANAGIKEYNDYVAEVNKKIEDAKDAK